MKKSSLSWFQNWLSRPLILGLIGGFWLISIGYALVQLWQYKNLPGVAALSPEKWPVASKIQPALGKLTLIMIVHPHCICTRASIGELAKLMTNLEGRVVAFVIFVRPQGMDEEWVNTDTWRSASRIPGVTMIRDDRGIEANFFGAFTSGQTYLYGLDGRLLFSGGITGARGHEGDNAGEDRIISLARGGTAELSDAPVFGCELQDPKGNK